MGRLAQIVMSDVPYHVTRWGKPREDVFFQQEGCVWFLKLTCDVGAATSITDSGVVSYANHAHLLAVSHTKWALAAGRTRVHLRYAQHVERAGGMSGLALGYAKPKLRDAREP